MSRRLEHMRLSHGGSSVRALLMISSAAAALVSAATGGCGGQLAVGADGGTDAAAEPSAGDAQTNADSGLDGGGSPPDATPSAPDAGSDAPPDATPSTQDGGGVSDSGPDCGTLTNCNGACVDTANDSEQCGPQCIACAASQQCQGGACTYATSCADLSARNPSLPDGTYTIQSSGDGGPLPSFDVFCKGMGTSNPQDYLSLVNTFESDAGTANYITVPGGGENCISPCTTQTLTRYWTKVRLDVSTLVVDQTDLTFTSLADPSAAACWQQQGGACGGYLTTPYATANDCSGGFDTSASANVDLRGTPFSIDPSVTAKASGYIPGSGTAAFGNGRQTLDITGGGDCGAMSMNGPLKLDVN
jgi:hypothetical protein